MVLTVRVPAELVPALSRILDEQTYPDDDGLSECRIMTDLKLTAEQFTEAEGLLGEVRISLRRWK